MFSGIAVQSCEEVRGMVAGSSEQTMPFSTIALETLSAPEYEEIIL